MHWMFLILAMVFEAAGTTCMKLSCGFTKLWPTILMMVFYCTFFGLLTLALKKIELSVAYPIYSGAGVAIIAIVGLVYFREPVTAAKLLGTLAIIIGIITLSASGVTR